MDNPNTSQINEIIKTYSSRNALFVISALILFLLPICGIVLLIAIYGQGAGPFFVWKPWVASDFNFAFMILLALLIIGLIVVPILYIINLKHKRKFKKLIENNSIAILSPFINDENSAIRLTAVKYIISSDTDLKRAIPYLEKAFSDTVPEIRKLALKSLTNNQYEKSIPYIEKALEDSAPEIRKSALASLENTHDKRAIPYLEKALNDKNESVRTMAKDCLGIYKYRIKKGKIK